MATKNPLFCWNLDFIGHPVFCLAVKPQITRTYSPCTWFRIDPSLSFCQFTMPLFVHMFVSVKVNCKTLPPFAFAFIFLALDLGKLVSLHCAVYDSQWLLVCFLFICLVGLVNLIFKTGFLCVSWMSWNSLSRPCWPQRSACLWWLLSTGIKVPYHTAFPPQWLHLSSSDVFLYQSVFSTVTKYSGEFIKGRKLCLGSGLQTTHSDKAGKEGPESSCVDRHKRWAPRVTTEFENRPRRLKTGYEDIPF